MKLNQPFLIVSLDARAAIFRMVYCSLVSFGVNAPAWADTPDLQTPAPVIYLADNLDEKDQLGWCIDTVGRGFSDRLHAHSCKPQGGDVQFRYDADAQQIISVAFPDKCASVIPPLKFGEAAVGLFDCEVNNLTQVFVYRPDSMEFHAAYDASLCLSAGPVGRSAGPFMARDLSVVKCFAVKTVFKQWLIKSE